MFGHLLDKKPSDQHGILYDALVNTIRAQIPSEANTVYAKVLAISTGPDRFPSSETLCLPLVPTAKSGPCSGNLPDERQTNG